MTHRKQDIELIEILQASCADGEDVLRALLAHTLQRVLEEEITVFLNAETYERTDKCKSGVDYTLRAREYCSLSV